MTQPTKRPVWWAVSQEAIMDMLYRVAQGEDPDMVYMEFYVNSEHEEI